MPEAPTGHRSTHRAVFVDRDGTLNPDLVYLKEADGLELFRGVGDGVRWLRQHGFRVICVTNQSGIERGFYTDADVQRIHTRLNELLAPRGAAIDAFYYCPHAPERGCDCRKPGVELFRRAEREWDLDLARSAVIGDRALDIVAGRRLGLLTAAVPHRDRPLALRDELRAAGAETDIWAPTFVSAASRILALG